MILFSLKTFSQTRINRRIRSDHRTGEFFELGRLPMKAYKRAMEETKAMQDMIAKTWAQEPKDKEVKDLCKCYFCDCPNLVLSVLSHCKFVYKIHQLFLNLPSGRCIVQGRGGASGHIWLCQDCQHGEREAKVLQLQSDAGRQQEEG